MMSTRCFGDLLLVWVMNVPQNPLPPVRPVAVSQRVRRVLDEARHDVLARRGEGRVQGRGDAHVDERAMGEVPVLRVVVRLLDVVDARADGDRALELRPVPREGGEAWGLF